MDVMHSCLCCLRFPPDKDLTSPYTHHDQTEIYSNMLKECFNIQIVLDGWGLCGICSTCADRLRDACHFKHQVQRCQAELCAPDQANSCIKGEELDIRQDYIVDDDEKPDIQMEYVDGDPGSNSGSAYVLCEELDIQPDYVDDGDEKPDIQPEHVDGDPRDNCGSAHVLQESSVKLEPATTETELLDEELDIKPEYVDDGDEKPNIQPEHVDGDPGGDSGAAHVLISSPVSERAESSVLLRARRTPPPQHTYCCDMCMALFKAKSILIKHIRSHYGYEVCKKTSMMSSCLFGLEPNCTENTREMKRKLTVSSTLTRSHDGEVLYSCDECGKGFRIKSSLREHIQRSHSTEMSLAKHKLFQCRHCACKSSYKTHLNNHQRIHTGEMFKCGYCNYKSCRKDQLQRHRRTHTGEKPFKCGYCDFKCSDKSTLQRHQRAHTGEKPCKCGYCDFKCRDKSTLRRHQRRHTGEKPFECGYCDYKCADKSNLKTHQRKHTGEKPFKCGYCDYKCGNKSNLKRHQRKHTAEKHLNVAIATSSVVGNKTYKEIRENTPLEKR